MARVDEVIEAKARKVLQVVNRNVTVVAAYLFGSQVTGNADQWSDIDLAVFAEGIEAWDIGIAPGRRFRFRKKREMNWKSIFFRPAPCRRRIGIPPVLPAWILTHGIEIQP